jgi:hypothetical protein
MSFSIVVPDIRNGDAATITQAAPKASIAAQYKWCHIGGMTGEHAVTYVDAIIRAQYSQLMTTAGDNATDAQRTEARSAAIVLGSVRAGASGAYRLEPADMNREEVVGSTSAITHPDNPAAATIAVGPGTAGGKHTVAVGMAPITQPEEAIVGTLVYLGMSVPVMQGVSLVLTGHHFLPNTKNVFMGMKRQAMQVGGAEVTRWVEAMGDRFDDLAFHKACHPIMPASKRRWAKSTEMSAKLVASGHGAAAIRLPALPSEAQGGKAAIAVVGKAVSVVRGMGHSVTLTDGPARIRAVETAAEGRDERAAVVEVKNWLTANGSQIAFCAGIVQSISEGGAGGRETTLAAFSIKKLMSEHSADVSRGLTYARAYSTRLRDQAIAGTFPDPNLVL